MRLKYPSPRRDLYGFVLTTALLLWAGWNLLQTRFVGALCVLAFMVIAAPIWVFDKKKDGGLTER